VLERCLQRLRQVNGPDFSVVVIDSAPNSSEAESVATRYVAQYVVSALTGLGRARNIGTRATDADIIAYLDDDMVPDTHWLVSLIAEFSDKDVMATTGPVLSLELADARAADLQLAVALGPWGPHRFQIGKTSRQWFERTIFGGISDGNIAMRHSAFEKIKLVERNFKIAYAPQAIIFHPSSPLSRDVFRKRMADTVAYAAFLA
jgi:GT2 family glycosyltransferase